MRVIALSALKRFSGHRAYADAREPLLAWYRHAVRATWRAPAGRVVFNIRGNKYRLVVWINYPYRVIYVRFIGTHAQYDRIDAQTV